MLTFHRVQVKNVRLPVTGLKVQARMAHNDKAPMQSIVYGNQEEVLAEDVHALRYQTLLITYAC